MAERDAQSSRGGRRDGDGERWSRIVLHADMDAFYAAVEVLDNPELAGKPLLVGGPGKRGVVTTASYAARPYGVGSAMPMAVARRRCPHAIVIPPRFERYAEVSRQVMSVFESFSPEVEALSLDEAFIDMTGAERLFGAPREMARKVKAGVYEATGGLTVSVGVSCTKYVAKVASDFDKPDGLTVVPPDRVRAFLDPLPLSCLWGVGEKTLPRVEALGLANIGDVARADPDWLKRELGSLGTHIHHLARGEDPRRVSGRRRALSVGSERTLSDDVVGPNAIVPHLRRSADDVARRLRRKGRKAGGVRVKLKTADFQLRTRQRTLSIPSDSADELLGAAETLLPAFDLDVPHRLVGLTAYDLVESSTPVQGDLFAQDTREKRSRLDETLDQVHERFGRGLLKRASDLSRGDRARSPTDLEGPGGESGDRSRESGVGSPESGGRRFELDDG